MTSNQIAYAQQQESARHNAEYEQETNRHNVATEDLTNRQLDIEQQKADADEMYKRNNLRLTENYNRWFAKYTEANEAQKRTIDSRLADIRKEMADADALYKSQMADLNRQANDIQAGLAAEKVRNNQAIETINAYTAMNTAWLKEHELEYKHHQLDVESGLKRSELNLIQWRNEVEADLKAAALNWQQYVEDQLTELRKAQKKDVESQTTWRPFHEIVGPIERILDRVLP